MMDKQGCYSFTTCVRSHHGELQFGYTKAARTPAAKRDVNFEYTDDIIAQEHTYVGQKLQAVLDWSKQKGSTTL